MKLHLTADRKGEIEALVGWMRLSLYNKPPALTKLNVEYLVFFEEGGAKQATVELEFLEIEIPD